MAEQIYGLSGLTVKVLSDVRAKASPCSVHLIGRQIEQVERGRGPRGTDDAPVD